MEYLQLACQYCAGQFSAAAAAESRTAVCPHCERDVTVPAATKLVPPSPPEPSVPPPPPHLDRRKVAPSQPPRPSIPGIASDSDKVVVAEPGKTIVNRRGEAVSLRRLSPEEKAKFHWRLNVAFAAIGMAILVIALIVLSRIRP